MSEDEEYVEYESGPYCRHWSEVGDCVLLCATCGHRCWEHEVGSGAACMEDGCACEEWKDPE